MTTNNTLISYAELERLGWPPNLIEDYQAFKRETIPQHGTEADPNGIYKANVNGMYIKTNATTAIWFNPTPGSLTGWIQVS